MAQVTAGPLFRMSEQLLLVDYAIAYSMLHVLRPLTVA